jgi:hypothetical protein
VNRRSDLPYNGTIWRFDRLFFKNWRPLFEVPRKTAKHARDARRVMQHVQSSFIVVNVIL